MSELTINVDRRKDSSDWRWWLVDDYGHTVADGREPSQVEAEIRAAQVKEEILEQEHGQ